MGKCLFMRKGEVHTAPVGGTPLSEVAVGSTLKLNVNGAAKEFLIVHQGNPDTSVYDSSCNGTWLLMKDLYEKRNLGDPGVEGTYADTTIHTYLNGTFFGLLDTNVRNLVKQVKIPYNTYGGIDNYKGANGLSTKVFLLSVTEVGFTDTIFDEYGAKLDYFVSGTTTSANTKRRATLDGSYIHWWLRSANDGNTEEASGALVSNAGACIDTQTYNEWGIRPAFILPDTVLISEDGTIIQNESYSTLLLLHGDAIKDVSSKAAPITNSGVVVSTDQSVFGGSSLYFNGSSRLDVNTADIGLDLNGDWTIDFWMYATANSNTSAYVCMPNSERGFVIGSPSDGYARIFSGDTGGGWTFIPVSNIGTATTGAWVHRAVVKSGSTIYAFENGTLYATISTSGTLTMTDVLTIGYRSTTTNTGGFTGYIDEFRISNVARWTEDFAVPTNAY